MPPERHALLKTYRCEWTLSHSYLEVCCLNLDGHTNSWMIFHLDHQENVDDCGINPIKSIDVLPKSFRQQFLMFYERHEITWFGLVDIYFCSFVVIWVSFL